MLKRLELVGFKSFADKTAFDFAAGITAVVGPNGSGKSNVVDAVKWVLGEQSARSLRGGEMADVIFNGSTSRRSLGVAEVTLTFDNTRRLLADNGPEVRVTRRVYRDGQGEYLLNGRDCRLKDIRELFLGTGAGTGAYSIIEQGRVDALLQSSQDDRRAVFEEAAGISRYKARKTECLRRLDRVAANLERLGDILTEVDSQLRGARLQASKAQKYQEYADRLRDLRVSLGVQEFADLTGRLDSTEAELAALRSVLAESNEQSAVWEADARRVTDELAGVEAEVRTRERAMAEFNSRAGALQGSIDRDGALAGQLDGQLARGRARLEDRSRRLTDLEAALKDAANERTNAEGQAQADSLATDARAAELLQLAQFVQRARTEIEASQSSHLEHLRDAARWQNEATGERAVADGLRRQCDRLGAKTAQAADDLASADGEVRTLAAAEAALRARHDEMKARMEDATHGRDDLRSRAEDLARELADLRAHAAGLASRIEILDALVRSHEGLGAGVRDVFDRLNEPSSPLAGVVLGWVGDCLTVARHDAALMDLALGPLAQAFIVRDTAGLLDYLIARPDSLAGRVGFFPVDGRPALALPSVVTSLEGVQRADDLVQCNRPDLDGLPRRLLGSTLVVPDLATARKLSVAAPGFRFVSRRGEILESDGTLTCGEHNAETGVLARGSELRELRFQAAAVADRLEAGEFDLGRLCDEVEALDARLTVQRGEAGVLAEQLADLRTRASRQRDRRAGLDEVVRASRTELSGLAAEIDRHERLQAEAAERAAAAAAAAADLQGRLADLESTARRQQQRQTELHLAHTAAQVAQARALERRDAARARHVDLQLLTDAVQLEVRQVGEEIGGWEYQLKDAEESRRMAEGALAELHEARQAAEQLLNELTGRRDVFRENHHVLAGQIQSARGAWQGRQDDVHSLGLRAGELRHRRDTLAARLAEDYGLDLDAVHAERAGSPEGIVAVDARDAQAEIDELRTKLARLGGVNGEALEELGQIETKAGHLRTQFEDLTHARKALVEIISTINADSERLFAETFAAIRVHFQDLFRRLFGGGLADVVLEKPDEPLDSPIDVVARPPGKELRSISLMSGGERTLTAVALLLAIFRSRPSPFCLLDEVDAALDEANTARLTAVLREFAAESQFIVITHAKRTMSAADVLYGVTMQESGVSKRVAVRFEDWPDEGRRAA